MNGVLRCCSANIPLRRYLKTPLHMIYKKAQCAESWSAEALLLHFWNIILLQVCIDLNTVIFSDQSALYRSQMHTHTNACTHAHARMHTHTHTHTHTDASLEVKLVLKQENVGCIMKLSNNETYLYNSWDLQLIEISQPARCIDLFS